MADLSDITVEYVRSILDYDRETGIFVWRAREGEDLWNKQFAGKRAGTINNRGYRRLKIKDKPITEHRLAWFYVYGIWPSDQIDHINREKSDNRIRNLRVVTNSENMLNLPPRKLGPETLGVYYHRRDNAYIASLQVCGKPVKLGRFKTFEEARAARVAAEIKYFGQPSPIDYMKSAAEKQRRYRERVAAKKIKTVP